MLVLLLLALLLIGVYDEQTLAFLTDMWQRMLAATGLNHRVAAMQQGINSGITKRLLPAVATYAALYLGICLLLLRLLLLLESMLLMWWRKILRLRPLSLMHFAPIGSSGRSQPRSWPHKVPLV